jgi:2,4-dienoyl-CoA reductase-like NADH-dependent reductase (Old Yellow Enzyme family)
MPHQRISCAAPHQEALFLASGIRLDNRVVVPPMASSTGDGKGRPSSSTLARYACLANSGAGLVMVEYTAVHASGRSEEAQLVLTSASLPPFVPSSVAFSADPERAGAV